MSRISKCRYRSFDVRFISVIIFLTAIYIIGCIGCKKENSASQDNQMAAVALSTKASSALKNGHASQYEMTLRSSHVTDFVRDGTNMMQMGDYMYSYGGWTAVPLQTYNDVYRSSGDLSTWTRMHDAPWPGRHTFGIAKLNSSVFVFGGDYFNNVFDVWSSRDGLTWAQQSDGINSVLGNRILYGACSHKGQLYVLGGQGGIVEPILKYTDVWSSHNGNDWTQVATGKTFLGKNISGACTSFDAKLWVIGGGLYDTYYPELQAPTIRWTNEVWSSPDGVVWEKQENVPWAGRQYPNVCVWDNKLWLIGGNNGANLTDIWCMDKTGIWTQFNVPSLYIGRHATGVGVYNDQLVITCGNYQNDCWVIRKL